ncbi:MAG: hypothetical protein ACE5H9_13460 [Anaerolineae bacterium]
MNDSRLIGRRLFAFLLGLYVLTAAGYLAQGDEETMYRLTRNLARGAGLSVGRESLTLPPPAGPGFLPAQPLPLESTSAVPGRSGGLVSKYALGQSLLGLPLFGLGALLDGLWPDWPQLGPRLAMAMLNPLALAATGWLLFRFTVRLGYSPGAGLALALAFGLATMAWPYVNTFYPQPVTGFFLLLAAYAFQRCVQIFWKAQGGIGGTPPTPPRPPKTSDPPAFQRWQTGDRSRWGWGLGAALGAAALVRPTALVVAPGLALALWPAARSWPSRWRLAAQVGLPLALALGIGALYNWLRFGSPLDSGYYEVAWTTPPAAGLYGLLFSPGKGVFLYAPPLLLSLAALPLFFKRHRPLALLIALWWAAYLAFYSPYNFWTGGFNWGPRFLLPLLAVSMLPGAALLAERRLRGRRLLFALLFGLGLIIQLPAVVVDQARYLTGLRETGGARYYDDSIYLPALSPVWRQGPAALATLRAYARREYRSAAAGVLRGMDLPSAGGAANRQSAQRVLQTEFLRLNLPALWWLHLPLLGAPVWLTAGLLLPWLGLLAWGGWGLIQFCSPSC